MNNLFTKIFIVFSIVTFIKINGSEVYGQDWSGWSQWTSASCYHNISYRSRTRPSSETKRYVQMEIKNNFSHGISISHFISNDQHKLPIYRIEISQGGVYTSEQYVDVDKPYYLILDKLRFSGDRPGVDPYRDCNGQMAKAKTKNKETETHVGFEGSKKSPEQKKPENSAKDENEETPSTAKRGVNKKDNHKPQAKSEKSATPHRFAKEEYVRKQKEKWRRQAIKNEYDRRIASQKRKNTAVASSAAASSAGLLILLGGFMYQNMGSVAPEQIFTGSNLYLGLDFGYGINITPVYFNSVLTTMNSSAKYHTTKEVKSSMPLITNLNFRLKFGYEHRNVGGHAFVSVAPGTSLIFHAFEFSGSFGGRIFAGTDGIKLLSEFETGTRSLSVNPWINPEETGIGKTKIKFINMKLGLKFSWYSDGSDPARNHLTLGIINETINEKIEKDNELGNFTIRNIYPDKSQAQTGLFSLFRNDKPSYTGYWLEWHHDHYGMLTFKIFPKYPHTGFYSGSLNKDDFDKDVNYMYLNVSYTRAIDAFFN